MAESFYRVFENYKLFLTDSSSTFFNYIKNCDTTYSYPWDFVTDLQKYTKLSLNDVFIALAVSFILTVIRMTLTSFVFMPLSRWLQLTKLNQEKFPESSWKLLFCTGSWSYSVYLLFYSGKYDFFYKSNDIWNDWSVGMEIPMDICVLYVIELGFYIHSIYGTLYMDHWRKDSYVMLFHHILSSLLITFSFATRYYKVGVLVLFTHDIADICLEFTKCNVYLKDRGHKYHALNDHIATVGFLCFACSWFWFRLYLYPVKVMYSAAHASRLQLPEQELPFYLIFNVFLFVVLLLNMYWWLFIVGLLFRVATGQMKEVDDIREEEIVQKLNHPCKGDFMHQTNGSVDNAIVSNGMNGKVKKEQ